jgi:hypothetical protein
MWDQMALQLLLNALVNAVLRCYASSLCVVVVRLLQAFIHAAMSLPSPEASPSGCSVLLLALLHLQRLLTMLSINLQDP